MQTRRRSSGNMLRVGEIWVPRQLSDSTHGQKQEDRPKSPPTRPAKTARTRLFSWRFTLKVTLVDDVIRSQYTDSRIGLT
jgi:hypothetical protein